MKTLLILLASIATALGQATGDLYYQKKAASGYTPLYLTPVNGQMLYWSGGVLANYDLSGTLANYVQTSSLGSAAYTAATAYETAGASAAAQAYAIQRANHTGTQSYTTITGLGTLATQSGTFSGVSSGTNTGDETTASIKSKLSITALSGSNTGDQDLSGYALTSSLGTAATLNTGIISGTIPVLTTGGALPAVSAVNLTNFPILNQNTTGSAGNVNGGTANSLTGFSIRSTGAAFDLTMATSEVLTAGRTLSWDVGNAARTITLRGNPTLNDWFDQSVKAAASPTFAGLTTAATGSNIQMTMGAATWRDEGSGQLSINRAYYLNGSNLAMTNRGIIFNTLFGGAAEVTLARTATNTLGITASATTISGTLSVTGASSLGSGMSLTGSQATNVLDLSPTWNTTGNPTLLYGRVTNTASGTSSNLIDLGTVAGGSLFKVDKNGNAVINAVSGTGLTISGGSNRITVGSIGDGGNSYIASGNGYAAQANAYYAFGATSDANSTKDVYLRRGAAAVLEQRDGTNAQTSRLYGTYTDASNYRRLATTSTTAGRFTLSAQGAGTGASGNELVLSSPVITPAASVTPSTNGDLVIESTSNTTLTFKLKGSDGTVRTATLTLAP